MAVFEKWNAFGHDFFETYDTIIYISDTFNLTRMDTIAVATQWGERLFWQKFSSLPLQERRALISHIWRWKYKQTKTNMYKKCDRCWWHNRVFWRKDSPLPRRKKVGSHKYKQKYNYVYKQKCKYRLNKHKYKSFSFAENEGSHPLQTLLLWLLHISLGICLLASKVTLGMAMKTWTRSLSEIVFVLF